MDAPAVTVLSHDEFLRLLATVRGGRIGLSVAALLVVLSVNFALFEGDILLRTASGTKFHAAAWGRWWLLRPTATSPTPQGGGGCLFRASQRWSLTPRS